MHFDDHLPLHVVAATSVGASDIKEHHQSPHETKRSE